MCTNGVIMENEILCKDIDTDNQKKNKSAFLNEIKL